MFFVTVCVCLAGSLQHTYILLGQIIVYNQLDFLNTLLPILGWGKAGKNVIRQLQPTVIEVCSFKNSIVMYGH